MQTGQVCKECTSSFNNILREKRKKLFLAEYDSPHQRQGAFVITVGYKKLYYINLLLHKVQQRVLLKKYFTQKWKLCQHFLSFMCFQTHLIITVEHKRCYIKGEYLKNILAIFFNVMKVRVCQVSHAIACDEQTLQILVHS